MEIAPLKNRRDYRQTLKEIETLMHARRNTPEGDRLDVLVTLVEAWERKHYPLDLPDPVDGIAMTADGGGYWLVGAGGELYAYGDAVNYGTQPTSGRSASVPAARAPTASAVCKPGAGLWSMAWNDSRSRA